MKMKSKTEYGYRFNVYQIETDEGLQWYVEYPDVSAVVGGGNTPEEAITEAKENLDVYLEYLKDEKMPLPIPSKFDNEYSGKVTLRMSHSLHKKIKELSDLEGQSINSFINEALSEKVQSSVDCMSITQLIDEKAEEYRNASFHKLSFNYDINEISEHLNNVFDTQKLILYKERNKQYSA